jgi:two-component system cell cycle sensor histidine kinase/response regulator CckA
MNAPEEQPAQPGPGESAERYRELFENAEIALRESQTRLQLATHAANIGLWDWDLKNNRVYYSPEWKKQLGYSDLEISSEPSEWEKRLHPEDRERTLASVQSYLAGTRPDYEGEFRLLHKDGSYRWIYSGGQTIRDEAGKPTRMCGCHVDITERRRLEEQLRQSQKMEAIGQLAGGVAHDFNNILAAIMMQAEMAGSFGALPSRVEEFLNDIKVSAERAANLTRQLLAFSRRQVMQPRQLDLNEIVTSLAKMLQRFLGEEVRIQINLHPSALITYADAGMLDQALMNLAVNARDAMPKGGRLIIETAQRVITPDETRVLSDIVPGRYVCLRVSDNGCGIPPETLPRIFEPFFTTKDPGKGTGLGLATVFGIVKQHRGLIRVYSEVNNGTIFQIFLPASDVSSESLEREAAKLKPRGGTETILVVEDEAEVRVLTQMVLESHGYHVLEASDGPAALRLWEQNEGRIDLLLTDMVMPELSGRELAAQLQQRKPNLKVIFTSGYSAELAGRELALEEGHNFLQKPWPLPQLLETVRRCLDS